MKQLWPLCLDCGIEMNKKQKTLFEAWEKCSQKESTGYSGFQAEESVKKANLMPLFNSDNNIFESSSRNVSHLDSNEFDPEAGKTWIYPTNYPVRDYQFSIVQEALFKNTLVILPTGLGKTFIAAVVMYNIYRWYPKGKVIFMAPTRPLVAQQVDACFKITGMSLEDTTQMTGTTAPEERKRLWQKKRVFFLTPQVLSNDIVRNICPASFIKCVVVDEAHKAVGNHAYCQVIQELQSHTSHFRVLALTATPGSDIQAVKLVLSNLLISHVEMRTEDSDDMKQYTHARDIEKIVIPLGDRLTRLKSKFLDIINIYLKRLVQRRAMSSRNPASLSKFQVLKIREDFSQHPPDNIDKFSYGLAMADFSLCISLYHAYELLLLHGARSFYNFLTGILNGEKSIPHARAELLKNREFEELLSEVQNNYIPDCVPNEQNNRYSKKISPGHPKLEKLLDIVLHHFKSMKVDSEKNTRVMIFSQYRDSVQEIVDMLNLHQPMIKCMSFIGQASKSSTSLGYSQRHQLKVLQQFRSGGYNTLVSTCVGEEGLDIGEVDLIVCYDCPKSPIRLVQRMGRTGRLRKGRIVILVTEGKEEKMYSSCEGKKKSVNRAINKGFSFGQIYHKSPSLVPSGKLPMCVKTLITPDCEKVKMKYKAKSLIEFLTPKELNEYNLLFKVLKFTTPLVPYSSFVSVKETDKEGSDQQVTSEARFSLSKWMLWQTRPHRIHKVTHSSRTLLLTTFTEQINFSPTLNTDNLNEPILHHSTEPIIDLCSEDNYVIPGKTKEYCIKEKGSSIVQSLNVVESGGPYLHLQSDIYDENKTTEKKNLLSKLFNLNVLPTAVQYKLNLKSPPLISDLKIVENSIPFEVKSSAIDKYKIISAVQILNKKMKAQLNRKMEESGINSHFTMYQLNNFCQKENSPLFCNNNKSFDSNYELENVFPSSKLNFNSDSVPIPDRCDKNSIVPCSDISLPPKNCASDPIISCQNVSMKTLEFDISFDIFQASSQFEEELEKSIEGPSLVNFLDDSSKTAAGNNSNIKNDASKIFDQLSLKYNDSDRLGTTFSWPLKLKKVTHEKKYRDIYKKDKKIALPNQSIIRISEPTISHKSSLSKKKNSKDINEDHKIQPQTDNLILNKENSFLNTFKTIKIHDQNSLGNNNTPVVSVEGKCDVYKKENWKSMNNCENLNSSQYSLTQMLSFIENTEKFESLKDNFDINHVSNPLDEALICESSDDEIEPTPPKESISEFQYRSNQDSNSVQCMENTKKDLGEKLLSEGKNIAVKTGAGDNKSDVYSECFDKLFFDISFDLPDENIIGLPEAYASKLHNSEVNNTKTESDEFKELDYPSMSCSILEGAVEMHSFITKDECFKKNFSVTEKAAKSSKAEPAEFKKFVAQQLKHESSLESKYNFKKSKIYNSELISEITTSSNYEKTVDESFTLPLNKELEFRVRNVALNKPMSFKSMVTSDKIDSKDLSVKECINSKSSFSKLFDSKEMKDFDVKLPSLPNTKSFISANNKTNCKKLCESKDAVLTDKSFHKRKRVKKKCNLILSQADVSGSDCSESDYESNNEDFLEESFIDDVSLNNHISNQQGMYLQSVKNCVGLPQKFKLKMNRNHDSGSHSKENDYSSYLLDSFCVNDDEIVFSSSNEETLESQIVKSKNDVVKRKRIVIANDSSSSEDDAMVKKISRSVSKPLLEKSCHRKRKANFLISSDEEGNIVSINNYDNKPSKCTSNDSKVKNSIKLQSSCCISNMSNDKNNSIAMEQVNNYLNNSKLNYSFDINWGDDASPVEQNSNKVSACSFKISNSNCDMKSISVRAGSTVCNNILTSNLKQPVSELDESLGNISESLKYDLHSDGDKNYLTNSIIHASGSYSKDLTILVDSRELTGGKPIISTLRNKYGINPEVMQLSTVDYVISNRLAIKRIMDTEFQTIGMPPKVVDKVKSMCEAYEKNFVIIQTDCRKRVLGFNKLGAKYLQFSLQLNFHPAAKVLFSSSFNETSVLIFDMVQKEKMKGHLIDIPVILTPSNQKLFDFYHSCPHVTPVCAFRFVYHFPVVSMFFSSSVEELKKAGSISTCTAISIHEYLKSELLFDVFS